MGNGRPCGDRKPHGTDVQVYRTLVFHYWVPSLYARRAINRVGATPEILADCNAGHLTKTREIIGTYDIKYKPVTHKAPKN